MDLDMMKKTAVSLVALATALLAGCSQPVPPHLKPLSPQAQALLKEKGMREDSPMFVRIFKEESELEVWKAKDDGRFHHFKTYPICSWSGKLGPKLKQGDKQAPEGFYRVSSRQMNPNSQFYLSFNLGYPNAYDKAHRRTGAHLMVHGDCKSAGCYAMTDALMEEIYILAREAFQGGQEAFDVHAYPFRMTDANMKRHRFSRWKSFWKTVKKGHDHFEKTHRPPPVAVCRKNYLVNVAFKNPRSRIDPAGACPAYERLPVETLPQDVLIREAMRQSMQKASAKPTKHIRVASPPSDGNFGDDSSFTFGGPPRDPSVAGFAFRLNSILGRN